MGFKKDDYQYTYISSATTTQVFTGRGILHYITVGTTAAGTTGVIDGISGTTVNVGLLASNIAEGTYRFDCEMSLGCRIITAAASKITVCWEQ